MVQPVLGLSAVVDIGTGEMPPNQLSLIVAEWIVPNQEPAIAPVALSEPHLRFVSDGISYGPTDKRLHPPEVVRMHFRCKASLAPLVQADAVILERHPVRIKALVLRAQYSNDLRHQVQHLPELPFACAQRPCEGFLLQNIDSDHWPPIRAAHVPGLGEYAARTRPQMQEGSN